MTGFRVYFKAGADNIELNIPDIYRDSDSETTTDQLRTYIANKLEKNYIDLEVDVKRGQKLKRKCFDFSLENDDEVYFYEANPNGIDVKRVKMQCGFSSHIENTCALNEYSKQTLDKILSIEDEHRKKVDEVIKIFISFLDKVNDSDDRSFIKCLTIMNYSVSHSQCYPFSQIGNKYYFCNFNNENLPIGIGYMFDFDSLIYFQGYFNEINIYHGKSICLSDDGYYSTCNLFHNCKMAHNGFKKFLFRNEVYSGCFVNDLYGNLGYLCTNEGSYEGRFKLGLKTVLGTMKYSNGDMYIGYWCENKRSFHGKMYYSNGDHYVGSWYDDKREEFGSFYDKRFNITYIGTFKDDKRCFDEDQFKLHKGHHYCTSITGAYEVELSRNSDDKKSMKIAKTCYDNDMLLSCTSNNIPCEEFSQRQCFYTGSFDYMRHFYGYGKLYINPENSIVRNSSNNEEFSGEYIKDKYKGYHVYQGVFDDNLLNGFGMVTYRNGDRYIGNFKGNIQNGHGTILKSDGTRYSGFWNSGRMVHRRAVNI